MTLKCSCGGAINQVYDYFECDKCSKVFYPSDIEDRCETVEAKLAEAEKVVETRNVQILREREKQAELSAHYQTKLAKAEKELAEMTIQKDIYYKSGNDFLQKYTALRSRVDGVTAIIKNGATNKYDGLTKEQAQLRDIWNIINSDKTLLNGEVAK